MSDVNISSAVIVLLSTNGTLFSVSTPKKRKESFCTFKVYYGLGNIFLWSSLDNLDYNFATACIYIAVIGVCYAILTLNITYESTILVKVSWHEVAELLIVTRISKGDHQHLM